MLIVHGYIPQRELVANLSLLHAAKAMGPNTKLPTRNEIGAAHSVVMIARAQMGHPDPLIATSFHSDPRRNST